MTPTDEIKAEAMQAIAEHLAKHGPVEWGAVRERFPGISDSTWWRLVRDVKRKAPPSEILAASVKKAKRAVKRGLPVAPSPDYIAKGGMGARKTIDFLVKFDDLYRDADMLREFATVEDGAGGRKIKNPVLFDLSIKRRENLIETFVKAAALIWDLRRQQDFYEAVMAEIEAESPECMERIMRRLERLNAERGMTVYATPGAVAPASDDEF